MVGYYVLEAQMNHLRQPVTDSKQITWGEARLAMTVSCPVCQADPTCFCAQTGQSLPFDFHYARVEAVLTPSPEERHK
jgi:hypothetical protein